ncbi:hypothetical protein HC62_10800 [Acetobacter tropicalis]|uniref:Uncharacterized protein n=1 Tax=Acetobacter tropicalis TaxID=104102 RepID=A0A252A7B0_9PROT|nr:hypothetical protein HC62_10800 [Acetobacter tropicalis]
MRFALCNTKSKENDIYLILSYQMWKQICFVIKTVAHLACTILLYSDPKMIFYVVFIDEKVEYGAHGCERSLIFIMK